jgi:pimeloyl-ACP methyl ester carboxylesterase
MRGAIAAVAQTARWDEWRSVRSPTMLVSGERGTVSETEFRQMRALRPDVRHVVIADAGHDAHLDQHDAWLHALTAFLDHRR